ncbi:Transcription factor [Vigna angularis]|uniref:Transcription factor n=1 Tax=Phaseolus angularis TaxID=3914 RepID=A0A8T0JU85_PHAAN|nr:Transcription factor [Vigna angularis]
MVDVNSIMCFSASSVSMSAEMNVFPSPPVAVIGLQCFNIIGVMGHVGDMKSESSDIPFQILNPKSVEEEESSGVEATGLSLKPGEELQANSYPAKGKIRHTKLCARGHWRSAEDAKLKEFVAQFGPQNWNSMAEHLPGRSGKSCRLRWFNQLDPRINRKAFSEEEEEKLLNAHKVYGNKWATISRLFPAKSTPLPFLNHCQVQNVQTFGGALMGLSGESRTPDRDVSFNKHFGAGKGSSETGHMGRVMGVDQSHYSDSNSSEVSESVATNKTTNLSMYGESDNSANMLFIDFLGVGTT